MTKEIKLPNGYKIQMKKEPISHVGRSIFRDFDDSQVVLVICDPNGKVTKRLGVPSSAAQEVAEFLSC